VTASRPYQNAGQKTPRTAAWQNHFGKDPEFLAVAKKTKEFVFQYALQKDGWWAKELSREGKVLRPFSGDTEGMYHLAEGLHEYSTASGDEQSHVAAVALLTKLFQDFDSPAFRYRGADFPYLWGSKRAVRPQGLWFLNLRIATQMLERENDPPATLPLQHRREAEIRTRAESCAPEWGELSGDARLFRPQALTLNPSRAAAADQRHDFFPANLVEVAVDGVFQA
jgi:hypothetical protein